MDSNIFKSPCCNARVRAEVTQNSEVLINKNNGNMESGYNFSTPEINRDNLWCDECGKLLNLIEDDNTLEYKLVITDTN